MTFTFLSLLIECFRKSDGGCKNLWRPLGKTAKPRKPHESISKILEDSADFKYHKGPRTEKKIKIALRD